MKKINTENAPAAIGPYSQAIEHNGLVYSSGQIPIDPQTGTICGDTIAEQTHQVMKNLSAVLAAAGSSMDKILKTTCFIADMAEFVVFNEIYSAYITNAPARSCVAVKTLPKNVLVEVDAIAAAD